MHQLDKETNEAHDQKTDTSGLGNIREFLSVRLGALLDQMDRVFGELLQGLDEHFVESFLFHRDFLLRLGACSREKWSENENCAHVPIK